MSQKPMLDHGIIARRLGAAALAGAALTLASCGGSGGGTDSLLQDVSIVLADYLVVDLATGAIDPRADVPDLATNPEYRSTKMVFKAIQAGNGSLGQAAGTFCQQADETPATVALSKYYIGVFEVTQAQWQALMHTTPWTNVQPASVVGGAIGVAAAPAFNFSHNAVAQGLASASAALHATFDLPTDAQWEYACRAGGSGVFAWGNAHTDAAAAPYAVVAETAAGQVGPSLVGSLSPNAFGVYDMEGNVWEMTKEGNIRGGSWSDTLPQARCANKVVLDPTTAHALVGARLVLVP